MARKSLMTWNAAGRRWFKKFQGKMYAVSCRQLGCPDTKEGSVAAANSWWEVKLAEIQTKPEPTPEDLRVNAFKVWSMVQDWATLDEENRQKLVDSLLGAGQYQKLKEQAREVVETKAPPPERMVAAQVTAWQDLLRAVTQSGQLSEGRFDSYCRTIEIFQSWIGGESSIDSIDEAKLEAYFTHLSVQVGAGKYSANYAHMLLMTARQFITRLAEMKLISLPGNMRSRRFRFNHSAPTKIETFTLTEVQELLTVCDGFSEKTKLYILLMLNCGMYQNDIGELLKEEVNWSEGTLSRARSKTRERNGPVVTYKLWPETFSLLKKYKAEQGELALTTDESKPLVRLWLEDGKMRRYDVIQTAWSRVAQKLGRKKIRLGMKHLRKTSASLLGEHPQFKFYANHFLADSPKGMADKHYVKPNDDEFFTAIDWLRCRLLNTDGGAKEV